MELFPTQKAASEALDVDSSLFSKALNPGTTSDGRLSSLEGKIAQWQLSNSRSAPGQPALSPSRPSPLDMLDSPERGALPANAPRAPEGLARAGGSIVARGYDDDGLMYAVEIAFYVRPGARETRHGLQVAEVSSAQAVPASTNSAG